MDYIDVRGATEDLITVLNAADKDGRPYRFKRLSNDGIQRPGGGQTTVILALASDDWVGPTPTITLRPDGSWKWSLDVYFG